MESFSRKRSGGEPRSIMPCCQVLQMFQMLVKRSSNTRCHATNDRFAFAYCTIFVPRMVARVSSHPSEISIDQALVTPTAATSPGGLADATTTLTLTSLCQAPFRIPTTADVAAWSVHFRSHHISCVSLPCRARFSSRLRSELSSARGAVAQILIAMTATRTGTCSGHLAIVLIRYVSHSRSGVA